MMRAGSNLPAVSEYNQAVILDAVRRSHEGISRVEVATNTGLSAQTVSNIVRRLLGEGMVVEDGTRGTSVGKPRTILRLQPDARFAVGVHIDPSVITIVLLDLSGRIVGRRVINTTPETRAPDTMRRIAKSVKGVIARAAIDTDRVMGLGIAAPGPIDLAAGVVLNPPLLPGWHDVPIRHELSKALNLPVILEKDVTAAVTAEVWTGTPGDSSDMLFLYCGTGVGLGVVSGGEILRGFSGNAGDTGDLIADASFVESQNRSAAARVRGPVGWALSPRLTVEEAHSRKIVISDPSEMTWVEIVNEYAMLMSQREDPVVGQLVKETLGDLAHAMVTLVNLFDVERVVFGGPYFSPLRSDVLIRLPTLVTQSPLYRLPHQVTFHSSAIGEDVAAVGAACLVLDRALAPKSQALLIQR